MMNIIDDQKFRGYAMAGVGFLMLLANAFGYIFSLDIKNPAFTILGLVFVVIGLKMARKRQ
jgi:hypothetical protein